MNDETRNTMTSTEAENLSSLPEGLQDDELSRRYYLCGFAALPWLWIVHTLHWYGKQRRDSLAALLRDPNGTSSWLSLQGLLSCVCVCSRAWGRSRAEDC